MVRRLLSIASCVVVSATRLPAADVEIFGGLSLWAPNLDAVYDASYTPSRVVSLNQIFTDPDPRSRASQRLSLEGETGLAFGMGVNVFPHAVVGAQFLFERGSIDIVGENPSHQVDLTYDTIAFPDPDRIEAMTSFRFTQPDTEGELEETTLSFNLAARFGGGGPVSGSISGGLSYFRFRVDAAPIGAHTAWLGGHAVLFSDLYEMSYSSSTADAFGFNIGGQLDVALGPHLAVFVDGRLLDAPVTEAVVGLDARHSANVVSVPLLQVENFLDLPPLEIDPGYLRVLFGLKLKL